MKHPFLLIAFAGTCLAFTEGARADVIVRLKSGSELYTSHTWTENGLVKFEHRGGVVGFPADAIESITDANARLPVTVTRMARPATNALPAVTSAETAAATDVKAEPASNDTNETAAAVKDSPAKAAGASVSAAALPSAQVPEVKGEDLTTRMQRLDDLSVKTHRELSVARSRGDPPEVVDALQAKVDEINRQRAATQKSLHTIR